MLLYWRNLLGDPFRLTGAIVISGLRLIGDLMLSNSVDVVLKAGRIRQGGSDYRVR